MLSKRLLTFIPVLTIRKMNVRATYRYHTLFSCWTITTSLSDFGGLRNCPRANNWKEDLFTSTTSVQVEHKLVGVRMKVRHGDFSPANFCHLKSDLTTRWVGIFKVKRLAIGARNLVILDLPEVARWTSEKRGKELTNPCFSRCS